MSVPLSIVVSYNDYFALSHSWEGLLFNFSSQMYLFLMIWIIFFAQIYLFFMAWVFADMHHFSQYLFEAVMVLHFCDVSCQVQPKNKLRTKLNLNLSFLLVLLSTWNLSLLFCYMLSVRCTINMDISRHLLKEIENDGLSLISAYSVLKHILPKTWTLCLLQ